MIALQPREIITPRPSMSLTIPEGMSRVEFFNSAANLKNLAEENDTAKKEFKESATEIIKMLKFIQGEISSQD